MWVPEEILEAHQAPGRSDLQFRQGTPSVLVVDDFFRDPDEVRGCGPLAAVQCGPPFLQGHSHP